jgi:thiamine kinase-like enzyme
MNHPPSSQYYMELFGRAILPPHHHPHQPLPAVDAIPSTDGNSHAIIISYLLEEVAWLKNRVEMEFPNAAVVFCHNDVNAANVLLHTSMDDHDSNNNNDDDSSSNNNNNTDDDDAPADDGTTASSIYNKRTVCIIDYEYGSMNYAMYDIANFICEHCGGNDTGSPKYELLPSYERQRLLICEYIRERDKILGKVRYYDNKKNVCGGSCEANAEEEKEVADLLAQVQVFQMASNLLWGVWGILQASGEVVEGTFRVEKDLSTWDNLRYGTNRLKRFRYCKESSVAA